ncbi:PDDEXK family nuclease [Streptomyces hydrogenans]|uniref:hypothetical protein n=1 Tax=Streptomyces hydrogenans TaxID=1873719 RepID=UPI0038252EBC
MDHEHDQPGTWRRRIGHPRELWPRETEDLHPWLIENLDALGGCLGIGRLEFTGREVLMGEQWTHTGQDGVDRVVGGLRLDLSARDRRGQVVVVEAQFGPADHKHLGQLVTYAHAGQAAVAVWVVVDADPLFYTEHLTALAELNEIFSGRRQFLVAALTLESEPRATEVPLGALRPQLRRIDLVTGGTAQ